MTRSIGPENATVGTILKGNGYATSWFGKDHNTPGFQYSVSGPFDQWPSGMSRLFLRPQTARPVDAIPVPKSRPDLPWIDKPDYNLTTIGTFTVPPDM